MTLALDPVARRLGFTSDEDWSAAHTHDEPTHTPDCPGCLAHMYENAEYEAQETVAETFIAFASGRPCDFSVLAGRICFRCGAWGEHVERGYYRCPNDGTVWKASHDNERTDDT